MSIKDTLRCFLIVLVIALPTLSFRNSIPIDHSSWMILKYRISFSIPGYHKNGTFSGLSGTFVFDTADAAHRSIDAKIPVNTVETGHPLLNKHLQMKEYFDAAHYPDICFHSDSIRKIDKQFIAYGPLTMKGVKKNIELPFTFTYLNDGALFKGNMEISAGDYGVGKKSSKGKDKVSIQIETTLR